MGQILDKMEQREASPGLDGSSARVDSDSEVDKVVPKKARILSQWTKEIANTPGNVEGTQENAEEYPGAASDNEDKVEGNEEESDYEDDDDEDDADDAYEFLAPDDLLTDGNCTESSPFLSLNMGQYTLHPRLRSLNKSQMDEDKDPVNEHICAAEALFREDIRLAFQKLKDILNLFFTLYNFTVYSSLPDEEVDRSPQSSVWISYIENKALEEKFKAKKAAFQKKGLNSEILLYHGTSSANTDSICKTNFRMDMSVRFAHGRGIYLSKYPTTSLQYGGDLIVCKVLLGRKQDPSRHQAFLHVKLKEEFDSKEYYRMDSDRKNDKYHAIVVKSVDQILPYCIISAEYPETVKIGGMKMTDKQLKVARSGGNPRK